MSFEGKVILLTGGSSGIGQACAEYFAKEKALLALVGRNIEKFNSVLENIKALDVENEPLIIVADVSVDFERIISETIEKYQRLDVLINNAAFSIPGTLETTKIEDFDAMFATNVRGLLQLTQLAVPHLIESKGNIVNVSSVVALRAFPHVLGYSMTKSALDTFTRCTALELANRGVRVNSVNPAVIDTPFHTTSGVDEEAYPAVREMMGENHPIGRVGEASEVVNAIAFVADENNSFMTGVTLPVDGGLAIKCPFTT